MATQKESDIAMLVAGQCHLGTKNCTAAMERYTFKRRSDGIYVFDLGRTYEKLCLAARVIVAIENPQDVVAISARPYGQRGVLKFANYLGARATVGRHTPGEKALARAGAWQGNARGGRGWAGHGGAAVTFLGRGGEFGSPRSPAARRRPPGPVHWPVPLGHGGSCTPTCTPARRRPWRAAQWVATCASQGLLDGIAGAPAGPPPRRWQSNPGVDCLPVAPLGAPPTSRPGPPPPDPHPEPPPRAQVRSLTSCRRALRSRVCWW